MNNKQEHEHELETNIQIQTKTLFRNVLILIYFCMSFN